MRKIGLISIMSVLLWACGGDSTFHENPYDSNGNGTNVEKDTLDPASFAGLHKQIFSVRCANPLCHDGTFEPDFRTMESAYNNLVYHPVVKNNSTNDFTYRVIPFDPSKSWLIERLTTDDAVLGRMPLYAQPLNSAELENVKRWINEGCKDISGKAAKFPNQQPQVVGRAALDQNQVRLDTAYDGQFPAAFKVAPGTAVTLLILVRDDSTATSQLKNAKVRFSYDMDDFSSATTKTATYFTQDYFTVQFNAAEFNPGQTVYFRFYCEDGDHASPAEFPMQTSHLYYKTVFAFIVK
ncbi:MAG: hypothetical protein EP332_11350 [Bacteroidetes bacterium]|nr:MAG: hypothetical protein EP332_11350 [Bacteroidota bacterium]